jgi:predicted ArsR family transcriptional regulator
LLADAAAGDDTGAVRAGIDAAARRAGQALAGRADLDVLTALRECGYEPAPTPDGDLELRNCPFHPLAGEYTELVCRLNHELVAGLLEAAGHQPEAAVLALCPGRCCVTIRGTGFSPAPGPRSSPR